MELLRKKAGVQIIAVFLPSPAGIFVENSVSLQFSSHSWRESAYLLASDTQNDDGDVVGPAPL
jgi:hypothetical protein